MQSVANARWHMGRVAQPLSHNTRPWLSWPAPSPQQVSLRMPFLDLPCLEKGAEDFDSNIAS